MIRSGIWTLAALLLLPLPGCDDSISAPGLRDGEPTIVGSVVARDVGISTSRDRPTVHVKEDADEECGIIFAVDSDTEIARATGEHSHEPAELDEVEVGTRVAAWAKGVILESCPGQAEAEALEIL